MRREKTKNYFTQAGNNHEKSTKTTHSIILAILFLGALGVIYITNHYYARQRIKEIKKLTEELEIIEAEYKEKKIELSKLSTRKGLRKKTDSLGLGSGMGIIVKVNVE